MIRFFRKQPGLQSFRVDCIAPEAAIRETARIRGKYTMSLPDFMAGKRYEDALCHVFYFIDIHEHAGKRHKGAQLDQNIVPTIPRGAMLPEGSSFLITAGRCISSDRETNGAVRVQCPCMAMGQAAGAMAALSARDGRDPEALALNDIYDLLRQHEAVIPGDVVFDNGSHGSAC